MGYTIITLLVIGIILFIISFFINNRFDELEQQIEQLSISTLQDRYILKNKIKVLEEELLTDDIHFQSTIQTNDQNDNSEYTSKKREPSIVTRIQDLYSSGHTVEEIEQKVGISKTDILTIINQKNINDSFI
ncbi:hypothetical protein ACLIA0_00930 [Bacillaceae bacterium W0354]